MTDKILCPWCGAEMKIRQEFNQRGGVFLACAMCWECCASGPLGHAVNGAEEAIVAARDAALRRYTPMLKPLTLEEVMACDKDRPLFHESKGQSGFVRFWGNIAQAACQGYFNEREYGIEYRYWPDRKPTEEEREAAAWET